MPDNTPLLIRIAALCEQIAATTAKLVDTAEEIARECRKTVDAWCALM